MNISAVGNATQSASSSSSQTSLATLKKNEETILNQIKQLEAADSNKNQAQIKQLQQHAQAIEQQILEQEQSQTTSSSAGAVATGTAPTVGPAYQVQLSGQVHVASSSSTTASK